MGSISKALLISPHCTLNTQQKQCCEVWRKEQCVHYMWKMWGGVPYPEQWSFTDLTASTLGMLLFQTYLKKLKSNLFNNNGPCRRILSERRKKLTIYLTILLPGLSLRKDPSSGSGKKNCGDIGFWLVYRQYEVLLFFQHPFPFILHFYLDCEPIGRELHNDKAV